MNHIVVIATGGTIASTQDSSGVQPTLSAEKLLATIPTEVSTDLRIRNIFHKDSSALTFQDLDTLLHCVEEELAEAPTGIVILHGTDTLETTALWLALTCTANSKKCPVIITGAIRPADDENADGFANISAALRLIHEHSTGEKDLSGVSVYFHDTLWDPWGLTKVSTQKLAAFSSPRKFSANTSPYLDLTLPIKPVPSLSESSIPIVPTINADFDDSGVCLKATLSGLIKHYGKPPRAVILCGLGSGNLPPGFTRSVLELKRRYPHILWLLTTRVTDGAVSPTYGHFGGGRHLAHMGIVLTGFLKAAQVRLLVIVLLLNGYSNTEIAHLFATINL